MAKSVSATVPWAYRIFFTSIDPLVALSGTYLNYFNPDTVITSLFPASHAWSRITPSHTMLLHQLGGALFMMAFCMVFLLRATDDLRVWKLFQAGVLITDFSLFYSLWVGLVAQDRLVIDQLRWEEWGSIAITGFVTVMRVLFLSGVGISERARVTKKKA